MRSRVVTCPHCGDSGEHDGAGWATAALAEKVVARLPQEAEWQRTRRSLLTQIASETPLRAKLRHLRHGRKR